MPRLSACCRRQRLLENRGRGIECLGSGLDVAARQRLEQPARRTALIASGRSLWLSSPGAQPNRALLRPGTLLPRLRFTTLSAGLEQPSGDT